MAAAIGAVKKNQAWAPLPERDRSGGFLGSFETCRRDLVGCRADRIGDGGGRAGCPDVFQPGAESAESRSHRFGIGVVEDIEPGLGSSDILGFEYA